MTVIDFAWARPSIDTLKAAGVEAVIRYVGPSAWGKTISTEEFEQYISNGIAVVLVFEQGDSDGDGGFDAGVANAKTALANLPMGWPADRPIYMAVDKGVSGSALDTSVAYIAGASSVLGPERTGDYGEGALCERTEAAGTARWHWQSESTSFPENATALPLSHLIQKVDASPIADSDLNIVLKRDFGQHPAPAPAPNPPTSTPTEDDMYAALAASKDDDLNATLRTLWYQLRTDEIVSPVAKTGAAVNQIELIKYALLVPVAQGGYGGNIDLAVAAIRDSAKTKGTLR